MIEPTKIHTVAAKLEKENQRFRRFLKTHADADELDRQFLALHNELFAKYDCCKCRNCCKAYNTTLQDDEIGAIAASLNLTVQDFRERYLDAGIGVHELEAPCCFLGEDGKCAVEECKPAECRDFPYTDKPERLYSLLNTVSFAEECPVVFEILERLKDIYGFNR